MEGDKEPVYEDNLEDIGRFNEQPVLPFNAYGTLALARSEFDSNSGSSQIFWLLKVHTKPSTNNSRHHGTYACNALPVDVAHMTLMEISACAQESELTPTGSNLLDGRCRFSSPFL